MERRLEQTMVLHWGQLRVRTWAWLTELRLATVSVAEMALVRVLLWAAAGYTTTSATHIRHHGRSLRNAPWEVDRIECTPRRCPLPPMGSW